ncbi:MAG: toxin [Syntrophotaleaceae bacterium]
MELPDYDFFPTPLFADKLERIRKQDPPGHARIMKVIERLLFHPEDADGRMHGVHHGRLKKYVGRRDYRLIYHWCRLCRKENRRFEDQCGYCEKIPDHSVIFFDVYHKNELAHLKNL